MRSVNSMRRILVCAFFFTSAASAPWAFASAAWAFASGPGAYASASRSLGSASGTHARQTIRASCTQSVGAVADCGSSECLPEFVLKHGNVIVNDQAITDAGFGCCPCDE